MKASTHVFASDLVDEGFATVLDTARDVAGLDALVYAGIYHHARDILPHNPKRKVMFHEGGAAYFRPPADKFMGARIQPKISSIVDEFDPLARLLDEADARNMTVRVWTNNLHNTAIGSAYPDCTTVNVFGDHYITALCPANPDVRSYVTGMSAGVARYGVPTLLLESASYQPFAHGYHHERSHFEYSPTATFLLSLCFCPHCVSAGRRGGVDTDRLAHYVRGELEEILEGRPSLVDSTPLVPSAVSVLADGDLGGFLEARREIVTSLLAEIVDAVHSESSTKVTFLDWSGGLIGYQAGDPVPLGAMSRVCDGLGSLGYTRDAGRFGADAAAYRTLIPDTREFAIEVRPMSPDCATLEDLLEKVRIARAAGADWIEFYHYGLMRTENIAWIGTALGIARS
jgi:hypothetical protein